MNDPQSIPLTSASAPIPPWVLNPGTRWVTVGEFAYEWNKHRNTIREWCETGYLSSLGIPTYRDPRGYWFIRIA